MKKTLYQLKKIDIINESKNISFLRRKETIKDLIDNGIEAIRNDTDVCDYVFSEFLTEVS